MLLGSVVELVPVRFCFVGGVALQCCYFAGVVDDVAVFSILLR